MIRCIHLSFCKSHKSRPTWICLSRRVSADFHRLSRLSWQNHTNIHTHTHTRTQKANISARKIQPKNPSCVLVWGALFLIRKVCLSTEASVRQTAMGKLLWLVPKPKRANQIQVAPKWQMKIKAGKMQKENSDFQLSSSAIEKSKARGEHNCHTSSSVNLVQS